MMIRGLGGERDRAEEELSSAGVPLAISDRAVWATRFYRSEPKFLIARDANGQACGGVAVEESSTRALPGHVILKVKRFGNGLPPDVCRVLLQAISSLAKKLPRVLRVQVSVFSRDGREEIEAVLKELGFAQIQPPSSYQHTLVIDLKPTEDEIFAALDKGARYEIRRTTKKGLRALVIDDAVYADRLRELQEEALHRTDGESHAENWQGILEMSREHPELSTVFGMFLGDDSSPREMAAFSWVLNNGDHGEYRAAGSTRKIEAPVPLGYFPVWEMIRWAKATGSEWFDMGGVTLEGADQSALEGISRFKRTFSRNVAEVGSDWGMEPSPAKAKIASVVSNNALKLRRLLKK